jgi:outer membrane receptor protein involved in Fe transport
MEFIPGMVVTQHSGGGKANQYFLRGMNLDHGTDFATTINGVPVNMPTHAHGHGYSDLNILIPELVNRVEYRKGPYFASEGDFSSAGSANIIYRKKIDQPFVSMTWGQRGYVRGVAAGSREISDGVTLLTAVERLNNDGPWTTPEGLRKLNALFTLSDGSPRESWSTSFSAYTARWNSTDQIPQRLIDAGSYQGQPFGRFDSLDPSNGATTSRMSLSGNWRRSENNQLTAVQWYAIQYDLDLYSNFTYALERSTDQFAQKDHQFDTAASQGSAVFPLLGPAEPCGSSRLAAAAVKERRAHLLAGRLRPAALRPRPASRRPVGPVERCRRRTRSDRRTP